MSKRREDWGDYKLYEAIKNEMGGALYHITDRAHLNSIRKHGLLSRREAKMCGVDPVRPGGNDFTRALDARRGLQDYVFLSFHENGLMPKDDNLDRLRDPLIVNVNPEIVCWKGVKVSLGRSTRSYILDAKRAYWNMDWEILKRPELRSDWSPQVSGPSRWNTFFNYEVLVPKCVPPKFIFIEGNE